VSFDDVRVDLSRRTVDRAGEHVHLTATEYRLLACFIANVGRVLTHRQLLRDVWGPASVQSNHYVRIYVANLRRKLEHDPAQPRHLVTETGIGYRFQLEP
jgi:two-component system KDP operon response regulator KdpE